MSGLSGGCAAGLDWWPYRAERGYEVIDAATAAEALAIGLVILTTILALIPVLGWILNFLLWIGYSVGIFGLVIFLMYKAYHRELYMLPWVGKLAVQQAGR